MLNGSEGETSVLLEPLDMRLNDGSKTLAAK
jgi:hypothetical protein